jgi:hypothetical protein
LIFQHVLFNLLLTFHIGRSKIFKHIILFLELLLELLDFLICPHKTVLEIDLPCLLVSQVLPQRLYLLLIVGDKVRVAAIAVAVVRFGGRLQGWGREWMVDGARDPDDVVCILLDELWVSSWETYHY